MVGRGSTNVVISMRSVSGAPAPASWATTCQRSGDKQFEYVTAARAMAASDTRILFRAVLPNAMAPTLVLATLEIGGTVLTLASLSFLGLGSPPPTPEWGKMVAEGPARSISGGSAPSRAWRSWWS